MTLWDHAVDRKGAPPGPDAAGKGPRVLVVDDDADVRDLIARILGAELSARVTGAADAYQALAALESEPYDALVLDLMLPGINGEDLLHRMRERGIDVDTIVISGWTSGPLVDRLVAYPAVRDVLGKPIDRDRLTACVERALLRSRT